jgi:ribosomal protein S18 acetylase RimI-like enzyme
MPCIALISPREPATALRVHSLLALAHAQEAKLIHASQAQPLDVTPQSIQGSPDHFLGAFVGAELVGALSVGVDDEPAQILIKLLVVHPEHQRQGLARALMQAALSRGGGAAFAVVTTAANAPALALYESLGFAVYRAGTLGPAALTMVKLRRPA